MAEKRQAIRRTQHDRLAAACQFCFSSSAPSVTERMAKEAIFVKPEEHFDGEIHLRLPTEIPPGKYLLEATLYGWTVEALSTAEQAALAKMAP